MKRSESNLMNDSLPYFPYHPNPLATGAIEASDKECLCCEQARGFIYTSTVFSRHEQLSPICPWCISDGSAAKKFDATFNVVHSPKSKGVESLILEEVEKRTPGFISWQQDSWLVHCNDVCEFHGDATREDVMAASAETKTEWFHEYGLSEAEWLLVTSEYEPGGEQGIYKFVCRHCNQILFGWDCS